MKKDVNEDKSMPLQNSHDFEISLGSIEDLEILTEHRCRMWEDIHPDRINLILESRREMSDWIREEITTGKYVSFIVRDAKGTLAGSGAIWLREEQPRPGKKGLELPYLLSMYTEPEFRRMGVGTLIVREAIKWAKNHDYYRIYLHASQYGRGLYEKLGFTAANEMSLNLDK